MENSQFFHGGAFDIPAFCKAHNISRALLYKLLREGRGPTLMKCGRRTLISTETAADWRRNLEAKSAA
ncbi:hypothetical protein SAMN04515618_11797 [Collimonas sp. OK307]|uniref:hypothetical protein n=1 Tax=Collimonas sp. OK307 TaxID=1801620 RepID=UPI0008E9CD17|nr:hypothetical protein [Collimonas sp. OK307]SFI32859.1 hypothetical protein SAMN04515618_11797 [Collimonas sp. OK307]